LRETIGFDAPRDIKHPFAARRSTLQQ